MDWAQRVSEAIGFIEEHLLEELTVDDVAGRVFLSPFYFQKGFVMLCGLTAGEYIRARRLSLAGSELAAGSEEKVICLALKYGYDSPDSFTKAFTRFHGVTPSQVKKGGAMARMFSPLRIKLTLEGGTMMDYKIVQKESFTVTGAAKTFKYDSAFEQIPLFWDEFFQSGKSKAVCGMYGVCVEGTSEPGSFEYLIADDYKPWMETPEGFVNRSIPRHTWAVFACRGPLPGSLQEVNRRIFSEWLPASKDYEVADGFNIEMYSNPSEYKLGSADPEYYSEIWIPVKKAQG